MKESLLRASEHREISTPEDALVIAAQAKAMSDIAELSLSDPSAAAKTLQEKIPLHLAHPMLAFLRAALIAEIGQNMLAHSLPGTEFDVHRDFWERLEEYIPGATRLEKKSDRKHMPDGWIRLNGEDIPVEIKRDSFTVASKRQLHRYMSFYEAKKGVAVAADFKVPLDESVIAVRHQTFSRTAKPSLTLN